MTRPSTSGVTGTVGPATATSGMLGPISTAVGQSAHSEESSSSVKESDPGTEVSLFAGVRTAMRTDDAEVDTFEVDTFEVDTDEVNDAEPMFAVGAAAK